MFGIRDPGSEIRDPEKIPPGSRILGVKKHRIPDPGSGPATLVLLVLIKFFSSNENMLKSLSALKILLDVELVN
jgi:hypothetical protein